MISAMCRDKGSHNPDRMSGILFVPCALQFSFYDYAHDNFNKSSQKWRPLDNLYG